MTDSVFRSKIEPSEPTPEKVIGKSQAAVIASNVEPPYLDWEHEKGKPYVAEYFGLGELWNDKVGGFEEELDTIKTYIKDEIEISDKYKPTKHFMSHEIEAMKEWDKKTENTKK